MCPNQEALYGYGIAAAVVCPASKTSSAGLPHLQPQAPLLQSHLLTPTLLHQPAGRHLQQLLIHLGRHAVAAVGAYSEGQQGRRIRGRPATCEGSTQLNRQKVESAMQPREAIALQPLS